jgi:hypothetical protein
MPKDIPCFLEVCEPGGNEVGSLPIESLPELVQLFALGDLVTHSSLPELLLEVENPPALQRFSI